MLMAADKNFHKLRRNSVDLSKETVIDRSVESGGVENSQVALLLSRKASSFEPEMAFGDIIDIKSG